MRKNLEDRPTAIRRPISAEKEQAIVAIDHRKLHHAAMGPNTRQGPEHEPHAKTDNTRPPKPMSAARLLAEAAFTAPSTRLSAELQRTELPQTHISFVPQRSLRNTQADGDGVAASGTLTADKGFRVFRVNHDSAPVPLASPLDVEHAAPRRSRRSRFGASDRLPGRVLHVVAEPQLPQPEIDVRMYGLVEHLAAVDNTLRQLVRAQSLVRIDDCRFEGDWLALFRRAQDLLRAVREFKR